MIFGEEDQFSRHFGELIPRVEDQFPRQTLIKHAICLPDLLLAVVPADANDTFDQTAFPDSENIPLVEQNLESLVA